MYRNKKEKASRRGAFLLYLFTMIFSIPGV